MTFRFASLVTGFLLLPTCAVPAAAQLASIAPRLRVDTPATAGFCPSLAGRPDGGFLVAWGTWQDESVYSCDPRGSLYSRPFDRNGAPEDQPSQVVSAGSDCVFNVRIGPPADDGALLTWDQWKGKYGSSSVAAKRSGSSGVLRLERGWLVPLQSGDLAAIRPVYTARFGSLEVERRHDPLTKGRRFRVIRDEGAFFAGADAAETADGGMVVTWLQETPRQQTRLLARRFDAAGKPLGRAILVSQNDYPSTYQPPAVAANAAGQFVVTWVGGTGWSDAMARVYDADGRPASPVLRVHDPNADVQIPNRPAMDERGHFVVLWNHYSQNPYTGSSLFAQMFDARGKRLGPQRLVADRLLAAASCGSVLSQGEGLWVLAWGKQNMKDAGIYLQQLTSD